MSEVFLDPVGDGVQWIELQVSPNNAVFDKLTLLTTPPQAGPDLVYTFEMRYNVWGFDSWDMDGLKTAARCWNRAGKSGWIVDYAIPATSLLKRLGRTQFAPMTMRANLLRYDWPLGAEGKTRTLVALNWAPVVRGEPHRSPLAMGFLELIGGPETQP